VTARPRENRRKLKDHALAPELRATLLRCGHETTDRPLVTGAATLYACPEGCGLRQARRRRASEARAGVLHDVAAGQTEAA